MPAASGGKTPGCWVDLFEGRGFSGKVRRLHGPGEFHGPQHGGVTPRSLIVGPAAVLEAIGSPKPFTLRPRQIISDLNKPRWVGKFVAFRILLATPAGSSD
jgi:hypothetical protein